MITAESGCCRNPAPHGEAKEADPDPYRVTQTQRVSHPIMRDLLIAISLCAAFLMGYILKMSEVM